jgi:hypothetical protein
MIEIVLKQDAEENIWTKMEEMTVNADVYGG